MFEMAVLSGFVGLMAVATSLTRSLARIVSS